MPLFRHFAMKHCQFSEKAAMAASVWQQEPDENDMVLLHNFFFSQFMFGTLIAL